MKKCASCTKDLPDAALHCVFCGAKQPLAPAQPPGLAKTVMGYSSTELIEQLKQQQAATGSAPPVPQSAPRQPAPAPPAQRPQPPSQPPAPQPPPQQPPPGRAPLGPSAPAGAATVFAPSGGMPQHPQQSGPAPVSAYPPPQPSFQNAMPAPPPTMVPNMPPPTMVPNMPPPPMVPNMPPPTMMPSPPSGGMGVHAPNALTPPPGPLPSHVAPYLSAQVASRSGQPIEPWKDSLRMWMFVWGALTLAWFATPVNIDPLRFNWDTILHGAGGSQQILAIVPVAIGLLAIVMAAIPLPTVARGIVGATFGLVGIVLPWLVVDFPPWQLLAVSIGTLLLVPGLLAREAYREAILPRILVTLGVIAILAPLLIPDHGEIPLVGFVKLLINAPGTDKVAVIVGVTNPLTGASVPGLAYIVIVVLALLAWMPAPATGGAKVFAWTVLLWPIVSFIVTIAILGSLGDTASKQPGMLLAWVPGVTYNVLVGYGLATVFGKQLE